MVSPHAIFRSSLEYVFHGFGNQMSLMAAAVTISRLLKDLVPALGGPVKIFSLLSPAPSPFFLLETPVYWQAVVVDLSKRAVSCPGFLCWRQMKNSLLLAITASCLSGCALSPMAA